MPKESTGRFDGPLTRSPVNPVLANGPDAYDVEKVGPRVVLKEGPKEYRMWYEAVPAGNRSTVGYAESPDGLAWTKKGEVLHPSEDWEGGPDGEISPNSILVEGGVRPQNMPPPDQGSGPSKAFLDYLFAVRKGVQQELLRRAG